MMWDQAEPAEEQGQGRGTRAKFFAEFVRLAFPYWCGEKKWRIRLLTLALVGLTCAQIVIPVGLNSWIQRLFDALESRRTSDFLFLSWSLLALLLGSIAVTTIHLRVKRRLQISWRKWLTYELLSEWMVDGRHYQVNLLPGEHDNPDGRIAEDIRIATEYAIDLAHSLFYSVLLLVSFTQILWRLSGPPEVDLGLFQLTLPGHLVWVALGYAALGTVVALWLGRPLVRAANRRQTFEANFRFGLVHARENSLPIALQHGEAHEHSNLFDLFRGAVRAWDRQTWALSNIFLFTSSWTVLSQVFPVLVASPRYMAGVISLGVLMQTAQAFQQMIASLSWPIDNMAKVAEWRASVERVLGLHDSLSQLTGGVVPGGAAGIQVRESTQPSLKMDAVSIANPDGRMTISSFSAEIHQGQRVLITGDPGAAGKLFKAVAGLWPWGQGTIWLPAGESLFFVPQRPYLPLGSLRDALLYPSIPHPLAEGAEEEALLRVGLGRLAPRLDAVENWEQGLAVAEQQRLSFARLLLHRPRWLFLQDATDALDPKGEDAMMTLLEEEFPEATVITIGHHAALAAFHQRRLSLVRVNGFVVMEGGSASAPPALKIVSPP